MKHRFLRVLGVISQREIIHQYDIEARQVLPERIDTAAANCLDEQMAEVFSTRVENFAPRRRSSSDRMKEVRFTGPGRAGNEEGIRRVYGDVGDRSRRCAYRFRSRIRDERLERPRGARLDQRRPILPRRPTFFRFSHR